jgi:hypothetical protein
LGGNKPPVIKEGNSMSHKIIVSEDNQYIITKHSGDITSEIIMRATIEAHALGEKLGIKKHLMDVSEATNVEPIAKTYNFAYEDIKNMPGINLDVRVAVLVRPEDHSHDFAETVTKNAGQDITIFRDREAAIDHLINK